MKKFHLMLVVSMLVPGAFFLFEARRIDHQASSLQEELAVLRKAADRKTLRASPPGKSLQAKADGFDQEGFLADFSKLNDSSAPEALQAFGEKYEEKVAAASTATLKQICGILEKSERSNINGKVLTSLCARIAGSDPQWAIAKLDQWNSAAHKPIRGMLEMIGKDGLVAGNRWDATHAAVAEKWLDTAVMAGRLVGLDPEVAALRAEIAAAKGNLSGVPEHLSQLPSTMQGNAAIDLAAKLETTEDRRRGLEQVSTALSFQNFEKFAAALAEKGGFDAAMEALTDAGLTPENYDLAAGSIAGAKIGPDTPARAAWLLETLRSGEPRALRYFADQWAHADFNAAANWMNRLPPGAKRDAAVSGFAPVAAKIEGASAADWAHTIADPLQRNLALSEVRSVWRRQDAAAADAYFEARPIDAAALDAATRSHQSTEP